MSDLPQQTAGDQKFSAVLFRHLPSTLDIDWDKFAQEMGLKDGSIAKTRYRQIRRKMFGGSTAGGGSPAKSSPSKVTKSTKKTANSGLKRAAKGAAPKHLDDSADDDESHALKKLEDYLEEKDVKSEY